MAAQYDTEIDLDDIVKREYAHVFNRVSKRVPAKSDAEDITQTIFLAVTESLDNYQGKAAFLTWMRRIERNKIAAFYRKKKRRERREKAQVSPSDVWRDDYRIKFNSWLVQEIMERMPEHFKEILMLIYRDGLSLQETIELLGISYEATRSRRRRALAWMKRELERLEE